MRSLLKDVLLDKGLVVRAALFAALVSILVFLAFPEMFNQSPEANAARKIFNSCKETRGAESENCYSEALHSFARTYGPIEAFRTLLALQKIDSETVGCHFIAHGIGYGTYERSPETWKEDFRNISQECTYGAMHGVLELAIADLSGGLTQELLPSICGEKPRGDCNHIVGHLALIEAQGSVPKALALCTILKDPTEYDHCSSGVFMEEQTAFNLINHGLADESWLDWPSRIEELKELCRTQEGRDQVMCWKELTHVFVVTAKGNAERSFALCAEGPTEESVTECLTHSVGVLGASARFSQDGMRAICRAFGAYRDEALCHPHMISSFLSTSPRETERAVAYCSSVAEKYARVCFASIGNLISFNALYLPEEAQRVCAKAPDEYRYECEQGGNVAVPLQELHPLTI